MVNSLFVPSALCASVPFCLSASAHLPLLPLMKIAFLIYQYCNYKNSYPVSDDHDSPTSGVQSVGGVERYVSNLSETFVCLGHEVHIFCHKLKEDKHNGNITFHHVPAMGFWSPLKIWSFAIISMIMLKKRKGEYDIIHSFGKTLFQDVLRMGGGSHFDFMKRTYPSMKNPILKAFVIINPRHFFNLLLEWVMFRFGRTKRIVCNSRMCKMEFVNRYHISPDKIDVIYNGVDLDKFSPVMEDKTGRPLKQDRNLRSGYEQKEGLSLLFIGSGFKRKGLKHVIESLALLDKNLNIRLIVAGRGRFGKYRVLAENLGVSDKVSYIGATNNVKKLYGKGDIFVFPTEYDAFPNVCLEAMAMELPVIVSRSAGVAEIIDDRVDGFVVEYPVSADEIADRIRILLDDKKRIKMGKAARQKAMNYSVQSNAEKTLELYGEICVTV